MLYFKELTKKEKKMEEDNLYGQMVPFMKEILKTIKLKVKVFILGKI